MFSPNFAGSRSKQPFLFLASLGLECALVALLCFVPQPKTHGCCLRKNDLRAAQMTPIYFEPPAPALSEMKPTRLTEQASGSELPSAAKPVQSERQPVEAKLDTEAKPSETSKAATASEAPTADGEETGGIAPFPAWQMSANQGVHGFHHQVSNALPVFTPEPPILHGQFPEPARGKELVLNVVINEEGSIVAATVLQGVGYGVEESIIETLKRWVYVPAKFNGMAIASQQELRFQFPG